MLSITEAVESRASSESRARGVIADPRCYRGRRDCGVLPANGSVAVTQCRHRGVGRGTQRVPNGSFLLSLPGSLPAHIFANVIAAVSMSSDYESDETSGSAGVRADATIPAPRAPFSSGNSQGFTLALAARRFSSFGPSPR